MLTLQFSTESDIISAIIRHVEQGPYSHVDLVLPGGSLLGARHDGGVRVRPADYARFTKTLRVEIPMPESMEQKCSWFIAQQVGKPYDFKAVAGFVTNRDWRQTNRWICSELIAAMLEQSGYFAWPLATCYRFIYPRDLLLILSARVPVGEAARP